MKRLLAGFILLFCTSVQAFEDIPKQIVDVANANVYFIMATGIVTRTARTMTPEGIVTFEHIEMEATQSGTGFIVDVSNRLLVTACHVVNIADNVILLNNDETFILTGKVASCDPDTDIAIIVIDDGHESEKAMDAAIPVSISTIPVKQGKAVATVGYPARVDMTITTGHWTPAIHPTRYNQDIVTANAIGGVSGGPTLAINDGNVEYVGIAIAIYKEDPRAAGTPYIVYVGIGETIAKQVGLVK